MKKHKNRIKKIALIFAVLITIIPLTSRYKDGGTVSYNALLWGVTKHHALDSQAHGYKTGITVRVLFFEIYSDYPIYSEK